MFATRIVAAAGMLAVLLSACSSSAFDELPDEGASLPPEVKAPHQLDTLRSLGEHDGVTFVAAKSEDDGTCLVMYRTQEPEKFVVGCARYYTVDVGGEGVGQASFYSQGAPPEDEVDGERVSDWLVIDLTP